MIKVMSLLLLGAPCLAGQAVPICSAVSDDARTIVGPSGKRTKDPSGCQWADAGGKKQLNVARIGVASMFERARSASAAKGKTQVENGLGGTAFATIPSANLGGRAAIYLLKGEAVLVVDIEGFPPAGAEERLPRMRDLVRKLVTKL